MVDIHKANYSTFVHRSNVVTASQRELAMKDEPPTSPGAASSNVIASSMAEMRVSHSGNQRSRARKHIMDEPSASEGSEGHVSDYDPREGRSARKSLRSIGGSRGKKKARRR